jgi:hypothetical protein
MGPSDSNTTSTQSAEYPPEFRPAAKSAVEQIQLLQKQLPLAMFTDYQPAGTAGIAPLQRYAMEEMLPGTMRPTAGLQGGLQTPGAVGAAAQGVTAAGNATQAENAALATLGNRLSQSPGQLPSSQGYQQNMAAQLPGNYSINSVFPGMSDAAIQGVRGLSAAPTPVLGGPGVTHVNPTQPGTFPDPYAHIRPSGNLQVDLMRQQLSPHQRAAFDRAIQQGTAPQQAFATALTTPPPPVPRPVPPSNPGVVTPHPNLDPSGVG